jgi:hypothetical protein
VVAGFNRITHEPERGDMTPLPHHPR